MEVLITDVTEMTDNNYCVAGWDFADERMLRLLPNGGNWATALIRLHDVAPGRRVRVTPQGAPNGIFPHRTDDAPIDPASIVVSNEVFSDWLGASAPRVSTSMSAGFGGYLGWNKVWMGVKQGVHTQPGVQCSSLVAIRTPKNSLMFAEIFGRLKVTLDDGLDKYQLTVSSKVLKEAWRAGGLAAVANALPGRSEFHVRIGLARPFGTPSKCYAMLNGVL